MTIDLHAGDLIKVRGYQQSPSGGLIPLYSICEIVAIPFQGSYANDSDRVRVVHYYPNNPAGWELPWFTVSIDDIFPAF